jgi:hypothetical protein
VFEVVCYTLWQSSFPKCSIGPTGIALVHHTGKMANWNSVVWSDCS